MSESAGELGEWIESLSLPVPKQHWLLLEDYAQCLWAWNQQLNLTRHTDYQSFVVRDIVDSLKLADLIGEGEQVLDIGSGGGVPGVVLAILRPDLHVHLSESVGKKARALLSIAEQLELDVVIHHGRAEHVLEDARYDVCTARAVGPLWKICRWLQNHWLEAGRVLATKGPNWIRERQEAREKGLLNPIEIRRVAEYTTPVINSQNVILKLWAKGAPEK